jgi:hypothetical protein
VPCARVGETCLSDGLRHLELLSSTRIDRDEVEIRTID